MRRCPIATRADDPIVMKRQAHRTVRVVIGGQPREIDVKIAPLVQALNRRPKLLTLFSCEGNVAASQAYVMFVPTDGRERTLLEHCRWLDRVLAPLSEEGVGIEVTMSWDRNSPVGRWRASLRIPLLPRR